MFSNTKLNNTKRIPFRDVGEPWDIAFSRSLVLVGVDKLIGRVPAGEARMRLITRSGFEQKHIFTSQIASQ